MSGATTELSLATAVDSDDNADYLTLGLANSLRTVDALFNAVTGHTHNGSHQGGAITPAAGSITGAMIANGTIATADIAPGAVTASVVQGAFLNPTTTSTSPVAVTGFTSPSLTCVGSRPVLVTVTTTIQFGAITQNANLFLARDGVSIGCMTIGTSTAANEIKPMSFTYLDLTATAAGHTYGLMWSTSAGTISMVGAAFSSITATELRV